MNLSPLKNIDLADLVSRFVQLRRSSSRMVGLCPFHSEKTPSFTVSNNRFHCFGCGADGDQLDFVQKIKGLSTIDAARWLSHEYSIDISSDVEYFNFSGLAEQFHANMPREYSKYLAERGIPKGTVDKWMIGYASTVNRREAAAAGLMSGSKFLLEGRITFPIYSPSGGVISFAGRIPPGKQGPKYINGLNTEAYNKSDALYGIHLAQQQIRSSFAFLVEGYTDVILMHRAGCPNTVASCGTGITTGHLKYLSTLTDRIVLATDPDEAGRNAARRSIGLALGVGLTADVLILNEDPADSILHGTFDKNNIVSGYEFLKTGDEYENQSIVNGLVKNLIDCKNFLKKDLEIRKISSTFGVSQRALFSEINRLKWQRIKKQGIV